MRDAVARLPAQVRRPERWPCRGQARRTEGVDLGQRVVGEVDAAHFDARAEKWAEDEWAEDEW